VTVNFWLVRDLGTTQEVPLTGCEGGHFHVNPTTSRRVTIDFPIAGPDSAGETHHGECGAANPVSTSPRMLARAMTAAHRKIESPDPDGNLVVGYRLGVARKPWVIEPGPGAAL
jgi:hypothetical protein